ncbi:MAG: hypothetical protein AB1330_01525 [Bacillota bacterium]
MVSEEYYRCIVDNAALRRKQAQEGGLLDKVCAVAQELGGPADRCGMEDRLNQDGFIFSSQIGLCSVYVKTGLFKKKLVFQALPHGAVVTYIPGPWEDRLEELYVEAQTRRKIREVARLKAQFGLDMCEER